MNDTVKLILSLSLSGTILAALIFILKPFIKHKVSKALQYYIWIIILLRLVVPFSFEGSLMNQVFRGNGYENINPNRAVQSMGESSVNVVNTSEYNPQGVQRNTDRVGNFDIESKSFIDIFNQYALYLWLLGIIAVLIVNLTGYTRFLKLIKKGNRPADEMQKGILAVLLDEPDKVELVRNPHVKTPMLVGMIRPLIILPDIDFDEKLLKNILLHEISHLKRFDIALKWFTMLVASIHWFNPLMYVIKKEIDRACELACDEAVIKNLNKAEKQAYGDTLIQVVSENKYSGGVLQATMCEEKSSLKERLVSIMKYSKKPGLIIVLSVLIFLSVAACAGALGTSIGKNNKKPPPKYNLTEIAKHKTPYIGAYSKVSAIVGNLPIPNKLFNQRYISLITEERPYGLNVFYEVKEESLNSSEWSTTISSDAVYDELEKNALILFCMIDNLDEITFGFRNSKSEGTLDSSKYEYPFSFKRSSFESYGDLSELGKNIRLLQQVLEDTEPGF